MLPDRFFYPLAVLAVAGILFFALTRGTTLTMDEQIIRQEGFVISGPDLDQFEPAPGTTFSIISTPGAPDLALATASGSRDDSPASAGVFLTLNSVYERVFAGQEIEITFRARQPEDNPSQEMELGYFTAGAGDSGWKSFVITPEFADYAFRFTPNLPENDPGADYVGIWPNRGGENKSVEIESVSIQIVKPGS